MDPVSIVVPAFNAGKTLPATLASIQRQTYRELEIVVVDDGSTDDTAEVVAAAAELDSRVRLVAAGRNRGLAGARNLGIEHSSGEWSAPCDADDLWHPRKIEAQVARLHGASRELAGVYCWSDGIDDQDRVILPGWAHHTAQGDVFHEMVVDSLPASGSSALLRRSALEAVGGFPEAFSGADDWPLYIQIAERYEWRVVPEVLVGYRLHAGGMSAAHRRLDSRLSTHTAWIREAWPNLPEEVFRAREYVIGRYLSFLALRSGHVRAALAYKLRSLRARPSAALDLDGFGFIPLLVAAKVGGYARFYPEFWREPRAWEPTDDRE